MICGPLYTVLGPTSSRSTGKRERGRERERKGGWGTMRGLSVRSGPEHTTALAETKFVTLACTVVHERWMCPGG